MKTKIRLRLLAILLLISHAVPAVAVEPVPSPANTVKIAAAQAAPRIIDFRLKPEEALAAVEKNLTELESIINRAGDGKCDALVLPEDTPGLLHWLEANDALAKEVLPQAVERMLERLGDAAARHKMYLVVCSDFIENDGATYNTSFLIGRDGKEIGRYHKVCPTWSEAGVRQRGNSFPVFPTPDLGTAGMLICYDLVVPETARCLALAGADIIFFPTMGGAAIGDDDIAVQALRVRAAENFIWLVVAQRGSGAMIISPQGKIVAKAEGPDGLAIADIDPRGHREGGDSMNWQRDMRARLFRERNPDAFRILTDTKPPVLDKVPIALTSQEAGRIMARALTVGEDEFRQANGLIGSGKSGEAISAFERLRKEYPGTWIDRVSQERLAKLQTVTPPSDAAAGGPLVVELWPGKVPGVTGIILKYRVPRRPDEPKGEPARRPLQDAQRAISLVRSKAAEWAINPNRIGIAGFSAGGHLAIATATNFDQRTCAPVDDVDKISCRPDFAIPVYSGYLKAKDKEELAPGLHIPVKTPPVFLVHGGEDIISPPENSVLMYLALKKAGVPAELHVYANTAHDFGIRTNERTYSKWTARCADWLRDGGFLRFNAKQ